MRYSVQFFVAITLRIYVAGIILAVPFHAPSADALLGQEAVGNPPPTDISGLWKGSIALQFEEKPFLLRLRKDGNTYTGTIRGLNQDNVASNVDYLCYNNGELKFIGISAEIGKIEFAGRFTGDGIAGSCKKPSELQDAACEFRMTRDPRGVIWKPRPQTPRPPFPYREVEVEFKSVGRKIAGSISLPGGPVAHPAVLLVSGSGPEDRDYTFARHKWFLVIANALARAGIAVLRVDDRGVSASDGQVATATVTDRAEDALAAVGYLRSRPDIVPGQVGILGHSEGAWVAAAAASRSQDIAFVVLLAPPGLPVGYHHQALRRWRAQGLSEAEITLLLEVASECAQIALAAPGETNYGAEADLVVERCQGLRANAHASTSSVRRAAIGWLQLDRDRRQLYYLQHDPVSPLKSLQVPALVIQGEEDFEVDAQEDLARVRDALRSSGDPDLEVHKIPKLNHMLQHCHSMTESPFLIEETISPEVLALTKAWITARWWIPHGPPM